MGVIDNALLSAWSWLPWLFGLGTIGWIALALLAPGLLNAVSPLLRGVSEAFVEFVKVLYTGLTDILDSWKTVVTVIVLILISGNYFTYRDTKKFHKESTSIHQKSRTGKSKTTDTSSVPFGWVR